MFTDAARETTHQNLLRQHRFSHGFLTGHMDHLYQCNAGQGSAQLAQALGGYAIAKLDGVYPRAPLLSDNAQRILAVADQVDALLLDSGNQKLAVKELGCTGRTHDWRLSRTIVEAVKLPVFLASGLNPDNVAAAISQVRPYGLDICSGVRTEGKLHQQKLERFIAIATHSQI